MSHSAYVLHLLRRVEQDVEFLQEQGALSYEDAALITAKLKEAEVLSLPGSTPASASPTPAPPHSNGSRVADLSRQMSAMSVRGQHAPPGRVVPPPPAPVAAAPSPPPPPPPGAEVGGLGQVKALWDYVQAQPDDLAFSKGEVIVLLEESNADWWKGQIGDRVGLFPSNHVERLPDSSPAPAPPPAGRFVPPPPAAPSHSFGPPHPSAPSYASSQDQHYGEKRDYAYQTQSQYGQLQPWQQQPPPAGPAYGGQQQVAVQPAEAPQKKRFGGKLGGQMASAAAGGVGFGAGAAVGSGIINAIF